MTPRERVLTALSHRQPDRTPRDFWAEEPTWKRLFAYLGHEDKDRALCDLGVDVRHLELPGPAEQSRGGGLYQNFWGERYVYRQTHWGPCGKTPAGRRPMRKASPTWRDLIGRRPISSITRCCLRSAGDGKSTRCSTVLPTFGSGRRVRGWEGMFVDMVERPQWAHFLSRKFTDFYKEDYTRAARSDRRPHRFVPGDQRPGQPERAVDFAGDVSPVRGPLHPGNGGLYPRLGCQGAVP